jgi:neopullulanase
VAPPDGLPARERLGYDAWWGLPALPKLNVADPRVREFLWGVAEHWLRFGIDGWRLDVPGEIDDRAFWAEFRRRCRAVNPEAYLVGEIWDLAPDWVSGDRFDGVMNYPLAKAILGFVAGGSLDDALLQRHHEYSQITRLDGPRFGARLDAVLGAYAPETNGAQLNLLDSHDTPRALSVLAGDRESLELATLLQASLPGAPSIYAGDEVGVQGGIDPDSRRAFPWDAATWDRVLLDSMRGSLAARHANPELRSGEIHVAATDTAAIALRRGAGGPVAVAVNAGHEPVTLSLGRGGGGETVHAVGRARDGRTTLAVVDGAVQAGVPARSGVIVRMR